MVSKSRLGGETMKKSVNFWQTIGFGFTMFTGTLLHFMYEWLGTPVWITPFASVNESTWEHMKLLFWPMFIFAVIQSCFFPDWEKFWCVKLRGILLGLIMIPVLFYTYNGAIAKSPDRLNILFFVLSAASAYIYEKRLFHADALCFKSPMLALTVLGIIALCFALFTFDTPKLNIFKDPLTGAYGL